MSRPWNELESFWACSQQCKDTIKVSKIKEADLKGFLVKNSVPKIAVEFLQLKKRFPGLKLKVKRS